MQEESLFVRVHVRACVRAKYSGLDVKSSPHPPPPLFLPLTPGLKYRPDSLLVAFKAALPEHSQYSLSEWLHYEGDARPPPRAQGCSVPLPTPQVPAALPAARPAWRKIFKP